MLNWSWDTGYNSRIDMGGGGTPHIRIGVDTAQNSELGGGTPHKKMCSDIYTGVGTPHITPHTTQNQGGHRT